ncbi:MAG: hypothetical protein ACRYG4_09710, partial [Janthinobacterium lividum]
MANSLGIGSRIAAGLAATIVTGLAVPAGSATAARCGADAGGITLAPGFCATIFADDIGHARHMVVAPDGTVYVNTWSGSFYRNSKTVAGGGFLVALKDSTGAGHADIVRRFGPDAAQGGAGGTGIALYHGALY